MKKTNVFFCLFVISGVLSSLLMIVFITNVYGKMVEINNNIDEMSNYVQQIAKIDDNYNFFVENNKVEDVLTLENEQCKKELEQIEQEIIDYQEKINSFK